MFKSLQTKVKKKNIFKLAMYLNCNFLIVGLGHVLLHYVAPFQKYCFFVYVKAQVF